MSGDSRVSIPNNVRKMIQELKRTTAGKHSDEFLFRLMEECKMDQNLVGERLKMIHDIREIAGKHSDEDILTILKDCNFDPNEATQKLLYIDTFHEVKSRRDRRKLVTSSEASDDYRRTHGNQWRGARGGRRNFPPDDNTGGARSVSLQKDDNDTSRVERVPKPNVQILHETENQRADHGAKTIVGVSSIIAVGGIKITANGSHRLAQKESAVSESGTSLLGGSRSGTGQHVAIAVQMDADIVDSKNITTQIKPGAVMKSHLPQSSQQLLISNHNGSLVVNHNQDGLHIEQLNELPKEEATADITSSESVPEAKSILEDSTPKLDPVVFPHNLQVPENYRRQLVFGSLDVPTSDNGSTAVPEFIQGDTEAVLEPSPSQNPNIPESESPDHLLPPPSVAENVLPKVDYMPCDPALKNDQLKQDMVPPLGGLQSPLLQTTRDYNFGLMPHVLGPQFLHVDVPDIQSGNPPVSSTSGSTPSTTQAAGPGQSSAPLSPPVFPYFRQPYAPNYFPYNPYFPPFYLPQNAHHLFSHGAFPQQPPTGNVYVPSAAGAPGIKFPVPTAYKQGTTAGSLTHFGVPSGYGSYVSPSVGYNAAATPLSSSGSDDLPASQAKENNFYTVQQGEESHVWASAPGWDVPGLPANYFYNLPPGPHVAFSPAQTGVFHPSQTITSQSTVQPLMHQSQQTVDGAVESMVPPSSTSYQQPQHASQINWNTTLLK